MSGNVTINAGVSQPLETGHTTDVISLMSKLVDVGSTIFKKRHPEVGARPGTLIIDEQAPPPKIRMISYDQEEVHEQKIDNVDELSAAFDPENVTWVDLQGFGNEDVIRKIGEIFSIHPLAMEDVVNMPQRPKAETYEGQILIITRMVRIKDSADVDMEQVTLILGENYVLTFQERYGDILDPVRVIIKIWPS